MIEPILRPPLWALDAGMSAPLDGEGFVDYWRRLGTPEDVIEWALDGLNHVTRQIANQRMDIYLRRTCPYAFSQASS